MSDDFNPGIYGAKAQSWRQVNPRDVLQRIVTNNPDETETELFRLFFLEVREDEDLIKTITRYWFTNNYRSLMDGIQRKRDRSQARTEEAETSSRKTGPTLSELADKQSARGKTSARTAARMCRLDTFMIDGVKIGDCTVGVAKTWADRRDDDRRAAILDIRFVRALVSTLPTNAIIRNHWTNAEEVDGLYNAAKTESQAA